MARVGSSAVLPQLRALWSAGASGGLTDRQLLDQYVAGDDALAEWAFEALVARHGPMVLGVCRRLLRNPQDAADAFQATFLVLVRRAPALDVEGSLGGWLHEVSRRIATQARRTAARRAVREALVPRMESVPAPSADPDRGEMLAIIDDEIARLPEKLRTAVVLCDLEGLPHLVVARQLDCPVGTIESRLSRGRGRLRARLARRGLAPGVTTLRVLLPRVLAPASVPTTLAAGAVHAAARIASGRALAGAVSTSAYELASYFLNTVIVGRLKIGLVAICVLTSGAMGTVLVAPLVARGASHHVDETPQAEARPERASSDLVLNGRTDYDPNKFVKIRPRFDTVVEKVRAAMGQRVKKGDPLVDLLSNDLAAAKNELQTAYVQWQHDLRLLKMRQQRKDLGHYSSQLLVDTRSDENKSRLAFTTAKERMIVFGVPEGEIEALIEDIGEPQKAGQIRKIVDKQRMTRVSPTDGIVIRRDVVAGNFYDKNDTLMVIANLEHLLVWAKVPKRDVDKVKNGQECEVRFPFLEQRISTKIDYVANEPDRIDGSLRIRMTIPNPEGRFKADMQVRVRLRPIASGGKGAVNP